MEKPTVHEREEPRLPLPLYAVQEVATLSMPDGETLSITFGLSEALTEELKRHALDETDTELSENTSDRRRFGEGSYEAWYQKERYPFALSTKEGKLAAIIWFGPEAFPGAEGYWDTVAFRSYPPYRGKGIMTPFSRYAIAAYRRLFPERGIWLETGEDNTAGLALYWKLGFQKVGYGEGTGRVFMTLS